MTSSESRTNAGTRDSCHVKWTQFSSCMLEPPCISLGPVFKQTQWWGPGSASLSWSCYHFLQKRTQSSLQGFPRWRSVTELLWNEEKGFLGCDTGLGEKTKCFTRYTCKYIRNNRKSSWQLRSSLCNEACATCHSFSSSIYPTFPLPQQAHRPIVIITVEWPKPSFLGELGH